MYLVLLQGTFVLQDNKFRWLARMSVDPSTDNAGSVEDNNSPTAENKAAHAMSMHLYFPCGIIRGALSNLGIPCAVSADISNLPACVYFFFSFFSLTQIREVLLGIEKSSFSL